MADNIGTVVQGAHSGFYVYWAKHLGIDKEAFYLSERKNAASVSSSDICLDTSTVVGYEEIGSRTGPNFNAVAKSTLLGGAALGLLASSVSNIEEATFVVFLKNKESCTIHLNITWAVEYFRRIFVTKKGAGPNGSNMQQGGVARVSGDPKVLLERAFMFLEDGDWDKADIYCESVLDQNPKCAEAYLGKLMAELQVHTQEGLIDCKMPFDSSDNYRKAIRFGDESLQQMLTSTVDSINARNEENRRAGIYQNAQDKLAAAQAEDDYTAAALLFESIGEYRDAAALGEECRDKAETARKDAILAAGNAALEKAKRISDYESALERFASIPGWKNADENAALCQRKIDEIRLETERKKEEHRVAAEAAKKKAKKIAIIAAPILCVCIAFVIVLNAVIIPNQKYNEAMDLIDSGNYESAYALLEEIGKNDVIVANKYDRAIKLLDSGDYDSAYELLNQIGKDDMIESSKYERAIKLIDTGDYQAAYTLLDGLSYRDSEEKIQSMKSQHPQIFLAGADVGDTVTFGIYEQNNNYSDGNESIEWVVIDKQENKIMVVSKYIIAMQPFNTMNEGHISWEKCTLRKWLNNDFLNEAFSDAEKKLISDTTVSNTEYLAFGFSYSATDHSTTDKIFLLSENERDMLSSVDALKGIGTDSVIALFGDVANRDSSDLKFQWWLRTTWEDAVDCRASVVYGASYDEHVHDTYNVEESAGVRPAMWISLK